MSQIIPNHFSNIVSTDAALIFPQSPYLRQAWCLEYSFVSLAYCIAYPGPLINYPHLFSISRLHQQPTIVHPHQQYSTKLTLYIFFNKQDVLNNSVFQDNQLDIFSLTRINLTKINVIKINPAGQAFLCVHRERTRWRRWRQGLEKKCSSL